MPDFIVSEALPPPGPYSHLAVAGNTVWSAGFGAADPQTASMPDGIEAQTEATIDNLERALREVGLGLSDVVKATVHLQRLYEDFPPFNEVYKRRFGEPRPVRTTVGSDLLSNMLVEIDVVAVRSGG